MVYQYNEEEDAEKTINRIKEENKIKEEEKLENALKEFNESKNKKECNTKKEVVTTNKEIRSPKDNKVTYVTIKVTLENKNKLKEIGRSPNKAIKILIKEHNNKSQI